MAGALASMAASAAVALMVFRTCFHPYVLVQPGCIEPGLLGAIVRGYDGEFKQVRAVLLMTLASDCSRRPACIVEEEDVAERRRNIRRGRL
jgi:hypothetical protein